MNELVAGHIMQRRKQIAANIEKGFEGEKGIIARNADTSPLGLRAGVRDNILKSVGEEGTTTEKFKKGVFAKTQTGKDVYNKHPKDYADDFTHEEHRDAMKAHRDAMYSSNDMMQHERQHHAHCAMEHEKMAEHKFHKMNKGVETEGKDNLEKSVVEAKKEEAITTITETEPDLLKAMGECKTVVEVMAVLEKGAGAVEIFGQKQISAFNNDLRKSFDNDEITRFDFVTALETANKELKNITVKTEEEKEVKVWYRLKAAK